MNRKELEVHATLGTHAWKVFTSNSMSRVYRVCECGRLEWLNFDGDWHKSDVIDTKEPSRRVDKEILTKECIEATKIDPTKPWGRIRKNYEVIS